MKQEERILALPPFQANYSYLEQQERLLRGGQKSTNDFLQLEEQLELQKTQ